MVVLSRKTEQRASEASDDELVRRVAAGDRAAFEAIYRRHATMVFGLLTRLVGPDRDREDLLQDTFVRLHPALARFRGDCALTSLIFQIGTRVAIDHLRRRSRRPLALDDYDLDAEVDPRATPEEQAQRRDELTAALAMLAKLKPIVHPGGTVTAGNASGINDGSCAMILASEAAVRTHGLTPRARYVAAAVVGVAPRVMGIGPVPAVQRLLAHTGLSIGQMDVIELNEAFAAQALAVLRALGLPDDAPHVNANGGAIAIGHPLGASGARLVTTAIAHLGRIGGRYALCTMCVGVGQGVALLLERA